MKFLRQLNAQLGSRTGYAIRRVAPPARAVSKATAGASSKAAAVTSGAARVTFRPPAEPETDRLLRKPVFIISPVRSGSTLLRLLLNAHSQLHSPHELHVRRLEVRPGTTLSERAMAELDLDRADLEHLLWDRVMHRELIRVGKPVIVEKTPSNAFAYQRLAACWPDARFLFLLRHPASIARSWHEADPDKRDPDEAALDALRYMRAVERARKALPGHTVRYEELTADPEAALRGICAFLGVEWEPRMLAYGARGEDQLRKGLGDWKEKIRTGRVQPGRALPAHDEIPEPLRCISAAWGYTTAPADGRDAPRAADGGHAEVAQVWAREGSIRVAGDIHGAPPGAPPHAWQLALVLRGHPERRRTYAAPLDGVRFDVTVPLSELAPGEVELPAVWDAYLSGQDDDGGAVRLRLGRRLDGVADKKKVMVFPAQPLPAGAGTGTDVAARPYYTVKDNLSIECVPTPGEVRTRT
ncbi:sulfotransferase [Streptomyces luomodiensis]|uniref:Sulfotransferase n=1 Tax=Streptomyces luomodiensis TaxID=3026192 RepID=A0ABY9V6X0_9ACTN|nr:sulfotransferase [Streptomyces sp. SCA4-21]WNE99750.1 sulfotransferase [Streptomyces sp. SCA4-21]